jgi:hypothetical protein
VAYVFSNKPDDPVVTAPAVAMIHISANAPNPFEQLYPELLAPPSLFFETLWLGGSSRDRLRRFCSSDANLRLQAFAGEVI